MSTILECLKKKNQRGCINVIQDSEEHHEIISSIHLTYQTQDLSDRGTTY